MTRTPDQTFARALLDHARATQNTPGYVQPPCLICNAPATVRLRNPKRENSTPLDACSHCGVNLTLLGWE